MKNFKNYYERLNLEQKQAVDAIDGPVMIVAGPGSGKTEIMAIRVANILLKTDTPPSSILCLTFTDSAAINMKERLVKLIGEDGYRVPVFTFHSFCKEIINNYREFFYNGERHFLADDFSQTKIIEDILSKENHKNPLSQKGNGGGFIYINDIKKAISEIKNAGLSPENFRKIIENNKKDLEWLNSKISDIFSQRISTQTRSDVEKFIVEIENKINRKEKSALATIPEIISISLKKAISIEKNTELTKWKTRWTTKSNNKQTLKDYLNIKKHLGLADIYDKYQMELKKLSFYDYSDMILDVCAVLSKENSLRYDLQEKYLYILVDEFQDTNGAQMNLLMNLTADNLDEKPNICVVGDDDQAIYRFQGAELSNILNFRDKFKNIKIVTLKKNYRSTQKILDLADSVISKGEERLTNLEEIDKNFISALNEKGEVEFKEFKTKEEEYSYVARKTKKLIEDGIPPEEIAIIGLKHKFLREVAPYLKEYHIPIYAQRREDVLENELVDQIITIIKFCRYFFDGDKNKSEEFLPKILSFPYFNIERDKIWKLSRKAYTTKVSWFELMEKDESFLNILKFLTDLAIKTENRPVEEIIDIITGVEKGYFRSNFKEYYFGKEKLKNPDDYFRLLSGFKKFIKELRAYNKKYILKAKDLIDFVDIHKKNKINIFDTNPLISDENAVSVITAHGAKGKEFEVVFALNCQQEVWLGRGKNSLISFPMNLPIEKSGNSFDDKLRLFYVTITRAKKNLQITSHKKKSDDKNFSPLQFIDSLEPKKETILINEKELKASFSDYKDLLFSKNEKDFLGKIVNDYVLSATALNNYLDVCQNGPESFLHNNLLKFPTRKIPPACFGTAVHETIRHIYNNLKTDNQVLTEKNLLKIFEKNLKEERLDSKNYNYYLEKGKDVLLNFYKKEKESFLKDDLVEKDFKHQGVIVDGQKISGMIDKIRIIDNEIEVTDFKTGKAIDSWNFSQEKKAWAYKNQLIFYKILIENSNEFKNYKVNRGFIKFIEPNKSGKLITLKLEIDEKETERLKNIIKIVGNKIKDLDFPSIEVKENATPKDIIDFENKLLNKEI